MDVGTGAAAAATRGRRLLEGLISTSGDPFDAVRMVLAEDRYDRVIISTLPMRVSEWLRRGLPRRVEALGGSGRGHHPAEAPRA